MRARGFTTIAALAALGCAGTTTQLGHVSADEIAAEAARQHHLALTAQLREEARLEDLSFPMLVAATPLCGDRVARRAGLQFATIHTFPNEWRPAAISTGISDTLTITHVSRGSSAERVGLRPGDRIIQLNDTRVRTGSRAVGDAARTLQRIAERSTQVEMRYRRDDVESQVTVPFDSVCAFTVKLVRDDQVNAFADGRNVFIPTGMTRFAGTDEALTIILGHEIAHNAMRHLDSQRKNVLLGVLLGAIVDVAAAYGGVNTGGEYANLGGELAAMRFSQDFEREADYVGLYIVARSGGDISAAPPLWRRMAEQDPTSIKFASSHPTTAERFVRLERGIGEINIKRQGDAPLLPEMQTPQ